MQVHEAQRVPNKMDAKRPTPRHMIIKMLKVKNKDRILKSAENNQLEQQKAKRIFKKWG